MIRGVTMPRPCPPSIFPLAFATAAGVCLAAGPTDAVSADARVDFNRDVRPILHRHCVACHGGVKRAADLSFVYRDQMLTVVEPGEPESSHLLDRVEAGDADERMPPPEHGPPLSTDEVATLRTWIGQGAVWGEHWAFTPPRRSVPPAVENEAWPRTPVDRFVLARLEAEGLSPSPEAGPERWLRRASLDLTGLPPSPEDRAAFLAAVAEDGDAAFGAAADRLLDSPRFGERWASVWLDLVRYADSKGLGQDGRRTAWKYRDWVIDAFNADLPHDEFTVKQLAGDLLPDATVGDRLATACHRLTQTNEEGGTDDEEFRTEAVIDRVNTTWQVWGGLTFGCVQCHSHPYDPIRHEEYYRSLALFNNTADSDLSDEAPHLAVPLDRADEPWAAALDRAITRLALAEHAAGSAPLTDPSLWEPLADLSASTSNDTRVAVERRDGFTEYRTVGTVSRNTAVTLDAPLPDGLERLTAVRFTGLPLDPARAVRDSEWGFVLSHFTAELRPPGGEPVPLKFARLIGDEADPLLDPQKSLSGKDWRGFGAYSRIHHPRSAAFVLDAAVTVPAGSRLHVTMEFDRFELGAFPLVARRGRLAVSGDAAFADWLHDPNRKRARSELASLRKERRAIPSVAIPVTAERPAHLARPTHVFERGNFLDRGDPVTPGTPDLFPPLDADGTPDRLDLARWWTRPDHPLTARVAVNRFWARLFGTGLVATEEDFGSSGDAPSHPALLDDLAVRFATDMDWSVKRLLRELVLSATYRQSAAVTPDLVERDPANRLLARGPRRRLPAETVRDQTLFVSGLLADAMHGPPVHPPIPGGVWKPFQGGDKWDVPPVGDPDRYRRSIYTYTKRSIPYPMFAAFDAPSREFCAVRRLPSNTPLQALMTLNDPVFTEAAAALAGRMRSRGETPEERFRAGVLLVTGREADDREAADLLKLYETLRAELSDDAALEQIATVLLNLDEVLVN